MKLDFNCFEKNLSSMFCVVTRAVIVTMTSRAPARQAFPKTIEDSNGSES